MAWGAEALQVLIVVGAALSLGLDMVNRMIVWLDAERCGPALLKADLTEIAITLQDALAGLVPRCTISALMSALVAPPVQRITPCA